MSKLRIHALSLTVVFENYQKQRTTFVERVAELANQAENIETLQNVGKLNMHFPEHCVVWYMKIPFFLMNLLPLIPTKLSTQISLVWFFEIVDDPNRMYG